MKSIFNIAVLATVLLAANAYGQQPAQQSANNELQYSQQGAADLDLQRELEQTKFDLKLAKEREKAAKREIMRQAMQRRNFNRQVTEARRRESLANAAAVRANALLNVGSPYATVYAAPYVYGSPHVFTHRNYHVFAHRNHHMFKPHTGHGTVKGHVGKHR